MIRTHIYDDGNPPPARLITHKPSSRAERQGRHQSTRRSRIALVALRASAMRGAMFGCRLRRLERAAKGWNVILPSSRRALLRWFVNGPALSPDATAPRRHEITPSQRALTDRAFTTILTSMLSVMGLSEGSKCGGRCTRCDQRPRRRLGPEEEADARREEPAPISGR